MDKYRPKRPTTLALFPQMPAPGTQDSINNNSLGKKDSWKDSRSSSPHIKDGQPKAEGKVRQGSQRRPAPKPPTGNGFRSSSQAPASAAETRAKPRERPTSGALQSSSTPKSQRRAAAAGRGGGGQGASAMRDRSQVDLRGKDGAMERKGRLCEDSRLKDRDKNGHQRPREANRPKGKVADGKGRGAAKGGNKAGGGGGGHKINNAPSIQEVLVPAMVVPRTPVIMRKQEKNKDQGQNHDRSQDAPPVLSRSSSEGGSNRMSISSDTEGPPPGPEHPSLSHLTNPDISEEDGEGDPTPSLFIHNAMTDLLDNSKNQTMAPQTVSEVSAGGDTLEDSVSAQTEPECEAAAGLSYDSVKYTLVVDEYAQLELGNLKDCLHGYNEHKNDSDTETVYQSANEDEDPECEEERRKSEEARKREERKEAEKRKKKEEEAKRRKEEDLKRRREEEVKRRREVVGLRIPKHYKGQSNAASEDGESNGGRAGAPKSKKFLNLFAGSSSPYSATGAGSFGMFSCVLNGVERQQSHRAAYRFVPRHADELHLETDDPVLMLKQSEDLWCQGYNMRTGATGIFPAFYAVRVSKELTQVYKEGSGDQFLVRFLGSVQVPIHTGNDVLCAAMQKVACNRRSSGQPPSTCLLEVSLKGVKISVQDQCQSANRGDQCFNFFQLKNISFCGCHPKHSKYFGFITKHPDQQRFACHVVMSQTTLHPLAESVGRAFQLYYKEHIGYSCPTEDIFIE
ncbi:C-Jun-amino-terminal kinase-interacting protein 1a isoform X2 [Gouania willdenowi]|uniref:C-Jun-amino-terminal kinase-interacting protein 1a isoform X2 n=1 Tax=Gouania willdenowi TaxID=441366 RepID=UPI001055D677|nr:C-Jun-amino-terminal kinase-interacting protein 1-like isoform X2 [Gouania willdenowi]